ncbi:hypothetical protein ACIQU5_11275 [Streptomyces sp. NPDC090306]|uniref:hypothetical protein n=1 Tax=Streptomyces sp. NPDC090306 TaxID=3365961 RepID=UPI00382A0340
MNGSPSSRLDTLAATVEHVVARHGGLLCVTLTRGLDAEEVLARLGADPAGASRGGVVPPPDGGSVLRAASLAGWTLCVERYAPHGHAPDALGELSRGTETFSVDVLDPRDRATPVVGHRVDGRLTEQFEPGRPHTLHTAGRPALWEACERRAAAHPDRSPAVVAVLAALDLAEVPLVAQHPLRTAQLPRRVRSVDRTPEGLPPAHPAPRTRTGSGHAPAAPPQPHFAPPATERRAG